jgi:hypothetical protein
MKFSLIDLACISKIVFTLTLKLSILEITLIIVPIKFKSSLASFLGFNKSSFVLDGIEIPGFYSIAVILIV